MKIMVTGGAIIRDTQGRILLQRTVDLEGKTADQGRRLIYQGCEPRIAAAGI